MAYEPLDITIEGIARNAISARRAITNFCLSNGFNEEQIFFIELAAGEAIANAVEHAYLDSVGLIHVAGLIENNRLQITIEDFGKWREIVEVTENRGRGFLLMGELMESYSLGHKVEGGTLITLEMDLIKEQSVESANIYSEKF